MCDYCGRDTTNKFKPNRARKQTTGMLERTIKSIDDLYKLVDQNPAEWSIAKSCAIFAIGMIAMERFSNLSKSF